MTEIVKWIKNLFARKPIDPKKMSIRASMLNIEKEVGKIPGAVFGDAFPLKHTFADGCYIREIFMPKDYVVVSKIHKVTHPYFILKGSVSVLTEDGIVKITAPYSGITKAGTKRILYTHEDTVWTTIHVTKSQDLKQIEKEIIAKNFKEIDGLDYEEFMKQLKKENTNETLALQGA